MRKLALMLPLLVSACATVPATSGVCNANGLDRFKGSLVSIDTARQIQRASGAHEVRWLGPKDFVTMEFRADRVNLVLDPTHHNVVDIRCG